MSGNFFTIDNIVVRITPEDILTQMGYPQDTSASEQILEKVNAELTRSLPLIEPKGAYLYIEQANPKGLEVFWPSKAMVLALATIGPALENHANRLINNSQGAKGLIADTIGTVATEQTANYVESKIQLHWTLLDWKVSRRYAPGYCGWDLTAQKHLLGYFPDTIGIKLTDGCLMLPEKSLSFVYLLSKTGDFGNVKLGDCKRCRQENCPYRLGPYEENL
jgi:hypothetical protein